MGDTNDLTLYRGRPYYDWVEEVDRLHENGQRRDALDLLHDLIKVDERCSEAIGGQPAPGYVGTAAQILSELGETAAAIDMINTYHDRCHSLGYPVVPWLAAKRREIVRLAKLGPPVENREICPACGVLMPDPPKRSGTCKDCGVRVLARKYRGVTVLRTEEQQDAFLRSEEETKKIEDVYRRVNELRVSDEDFESWWGQVSDKQRRQASIGDAFFSLAAELSRERAVGPNAFRDLAELHQAQAEHLVSEGRDWTTPARLAIEFRLHDLKGPVELMRHQDGDAEARRVEIVAACLCEPCSERSDPTTIREALANPGLPHVNCQSPPCKCFYRHDPDQPPPSYTITR